MKKLLVLLGILYVAVYTTDKAPPIEIKKIPLSEPTQVEKFMSRVARIESNGNFRVKNQFGMMGKYQFSPSTVRVLGFKVTEKQFLNNPKIQDSVMLAYMKANHQELEPIIKKYNGKMFKGIRVTRAGILAGAHFAGTTGVINYFKSDEHYGTSDANGTTLRYYMAQFSNFNLPELL